VRLPLLAPGVGLTLWRSSALVTCLTDRTRRLLAEAQPRIVCIHAGPSRLLDAVPSLATAIRTYVPDVRLWLGRGLDVYTEGYVRGVLSLAKAVDAAADASDLAVSVGAECVVDDLEGPGKSPGDRDAEFYRALLTEHRRRAPRTPLGHATYSTPAHLSDYPSGHSAWIWRTACGAEGVDFVLPMTYVAPPQYTVVDGKHVPVTTPRIAARGALSRELSACDRSYHAAERQGLVRPLLPRGLYLQLHHTPTAQIVTAAGTGDRPWSLLWCGPEVAAGGRMDDVGELAARRLCALDRAGWVGSAGDMAGHYAELQTLVGVTTDGIVGEGTWGAWTRAGRPPRVA
jgi:hypothetical protein